MTPQDLVEQQGVRNAVRRAGQRSLRARVGRLARRDRASEKSLKAPGGAIALSQPLCGSRTRLVTTQLHHMRDNGIRYGLQIMCEGGGHATPPSSSCSEMYRTDLQIEGRWVDGEPIEVLEAMKIGPALAAGCLSPRGNE